jgi:precorrin-3B methylase
MTSPRRGTLVVVGTGIQLINHLTHEALFSIRSAEKVLHVLADGLTQRYIESLNPSAESLNYLYEEGKPRQETYLEMIEVIMGHLRSGLRVCAVFYGHPGVFVYPSHEAIRLARSEGYEARMLPGISAEDCLFADLGIDPGSTGCQSFEATDFLVHRRRFDPSSTLVLWQAGVLGVRDARIDGRPSPHIGILTEVLEEHYGPDHEVIVYEASIFPYPIAGTSVQRTTVAGLTGARITQMCTLFVPPRESIPDEAMMRRLGLAPRL